LTNGLGYQCFFQSEVQIMMVIWIKCSTELKLHFTCFSLNVHSDVSVIYRHTASVAAGNHGIPVVVAGQFFGNASGMAPHSQ